MKKLILFLVLISASVFGKAQTQANDSIYESYTVYEPSKATQEPTKTPSTEKQSYNINNSYNTNNTSTNISSLDSDDTILKREARYERNQLLRESVSIITYSVCAVLTIVLFRNYITIY